MDRWLAAALDYIPRWLDFQMQVSQQPGCIIAIAHRGNVVLERAFGTANLDTGEALTPRHRFRVASHSKSFTAAGIMKLREQRKLKLDDAAGRLRRRPAPAMSRARPSRSFSRIPPASSVTARMPANSSTGGRTCNEAELRAELKLPLVIAPGTRMKYSNHGFGLLGLIIKAITGEPYATWIKREIVDAAGLKETTPDMPLSAARRSRAATPGASCSAAASSFRATTRATRSTRRAASSARPPTSHAISRSLRPTRAAASFRPRAAAR